jgi:hypothetical protein
MTTQVNSTSVSFAIKPLVMSLRAVLPHSLVFTLHVMILELIS